MSESASSVAVELRAEGFGREFLRQFTAGFRHHGLLYAGASAVFAAGYAISLVSGYMVAASPMGFAISYVGLAALYVGLCIVPYKLTRMVLVEKPVRPLMELIRWGREDIFNPARLANGVNGLAIVFLLMAGFAMAKNNVSRFGGFRWDEWLSNLDRTLHFGYLPHEWLQPILGSPWTTVLIDRNYVMWFSVLFASCFVVAFQSERSPGRHRFLLALLFTWGAGGMITALLFSSAGPVYFARVTGLADPYSAHFAYLREIGRINGLVAPGIQEKLWSAYTGEPSLSLISAMPSLHSAIAVLVGLGCWSRGGVLRQLGAAFAALIVLGSVHLGWHYAVDAYAGIAIACLSWWGALPVTRWYLAGGGRAAPAAQAA